MRRGVLFLVCAVAFGQTEPRDPFDRAMQLSQQARTQGNSAEAAAHREEARSLIEKTPLDSKQWAFRVQNLAQSYQGSGRYVQARAVVQGALARAQALPEWDPVRIQLLNMLAEFWQQDGNLLQAVSYREKAVAAFEATPPGAAVAAQRDPAGISVSQLSSGPFIAMSSLTMARFYSGGNNSQLYEQLATLYRQLGRPDAAAKATAKMRSLIQNDPGALAASYAEDGNIDQALALYQKQAAENSANPQAKPWEIVAPYQSMASLYQQEQRLPEAIAALQQGAARLDSSNEPEMASPAKNLRLQMAGLLQQSGQTQAAEQIYQALLSEPANRGPEMQIQVLLLYANYLSDTGRGSQAGEMLQDYLSSHADLPSWQQANLLMALAQIARKTGQKDVADQYQQAAMEKQRAGQPAQVGKQVVPEMQTAQRAANDGKLDEALNLALAAIAAAPTAPDGEQIFWQAPSLAAQLAGHNAPDKGEQIYRALFPLLEARAVYDVTPLQQLLRQYARFLMGQKDRRGDAAVALDRYRDSIVSTQGADTEGSVVAQRLQLELAQAKGAPEEAAQKADELLALEESLSGATSSRYMNAAQAAVAAYQTAGKTERALALYREIVSLADLTLAKTDSRRAFVRMTAAMAFAGARQFDEAERLANEAVAIGQTTRPPQQDGLRTQLEQIQKMKANPATPGSTSGRLGSLWFTHQ